MTFVRSLILSALMLAIAAVPSSAVVGGRDASPGEYPSVAEITFGPFLCTGTLISPTWVLSAGHCSSVTGAAVASPASWPAAAINVRIGGVNQDDGEVVPVKQVIVHPDYLLTDGYDISLLELTRASTMTPTQVAGSSEGDLWSPGTMETIVGWGATEEGGDLPDRLQEAEVPITTDAYCDNAYADSGGIDEATMVCAGFPQGGVDTCQGDSGGPMFGRTSTGALRVVGATSWGEGCARPGKPGVYARVAGATLRPWIASHTSAGVARASRTKRSRSARRKARRRAEARAHRRAQRLQVGARWYSAR
jgi:trypsin